MPRNVTLGELIDGVRAEAGHSLQPNLGIAMRDVLIKVIQRQQSRLWADYDWPFLRVKEEFAVQAGQRFYDFPDALTIERVECVEFWSGSRWHTLDYGIGPEHLELHDSESDVRSYPVERWCEAPAEQLEVWPVPSQDGTMTPREGVLRFTGIRKLSRLVQEADRADLDDHLLILYSAAEVLAREKGSDAGLKLQLADAHYRRLRGRNAKRSTFSLSGHEPRYETRGPKVVAWRTK